MKGASNMSEWRYEESIWVDKMGEEKNKFLQWNKVEGETQSIFSFIDSFHHLPLGRGESLKCGMKLLLRGEGTSAAGLAKGQDGD